MKYSVDWPTLKAFAVARNLSIQWFVSGNLYLICAIDNKLVLKTQIPIVNPAPAESSQADFEANFKNSGNGILTTTTQPFASKVLQSGQSLYKRITGTSKSMQQGSNTFSWVQSAYSHVKFTAIEVINAEIGDTCNLVVLDTSTGTYSGIPSAPLNQFAFNINLCPQFYRYQSEFDADIYQNLQIQIVYNSVSPKTVYFNLDFNQVK